METAENTYDDREARAILTDAMEKLSPTPDTEEVARQLAKRLYSMLQELGFVVSAAYREPQLEVIRPGTQSRVLLNWARGDFRVSFDGKDGEPVAVKYERLTQTFTGTEPDSFIAPEPGQPRRMRSGLAVLADAIVQKLLP